MWFGLSKRLCQSTQCSVRTCNIMQPDFPRYWQDGPILNIISENNLSICASGVGRHGFALIISNHHVILAQVPWSKIASFCFLGLGLLWSDHRTRTIPRVESLPFGVHVYKGASTSLRVASGWRDMIIVVTQPLERKCFFFSAAVS